VGLDRDERGAAHLLGADHSARELGRQCRLSLAALPAHHGVRVLRLVAQQSLEREQFPAAMSEASFPFSSTQRCNS
jgi:hypothetical protein